MSSSSDSQYRGPVIRVAVPSPLRRLFDYLPAAATAFDAIHPGCRVLVPFGNRRLVGIVVERANYSTLPKSKLKPVSAVLDDEPLYTKAMQAVLLWASRYYQHPAGEVFATALPAKLRAGKTRVQLSSSWRIQNPLQEADQSALKNAHKQRQLLDFISGQGQASNEQIKQAGFTLRILNELTKKQLVIEEQIGQKADTPFAALAPVTRFEITLNEEQQSAVEKVSKKLDQYACFLLDGVTGSGKTEVYMRLMQEQLAKAKQCLILVPEIGLTPQTVARFQQRFDCPVVTLHSGLNDSERLDAWNKACNGSAGIIIGTRSAIFTPMANPGLIVIDEEHDSSLKQQDGFRYSARDLAVVRAREENICVVLGSATPSLESLHNAKTKKFSHLRLHQRAGAASSSTIEVVDIANQSLEEGFSELLLYKIQKHLQQKNQVLVFINRRGFAPILNCQQCGWTSECEHCIAQLTLHSKPPSMRCHHCGVIKQVPPHCPHCLSKNLTSFGMGTQKIEHFLQNKFAGTPVIRVDRDSMRGKSSLNEMLDQVHSGEPCILLGTQMLAKGHHFPKISLAAILDADVGLFSADFRGQEHMAQTIIQVAGRAGREQYNGEVLIQSRHAGHAILQSLAGGDYDEFTEFLLRERKQAGMPPFAHLSLIRAEAMELNQALEFLRKVRRQAESQLSESQKAVTLMGPLPAPMEKRAGRYRVQLLLRSSSRANLQDLLTPLCAFMETSKCPAKLRWSVDVDPQDLI